MVFIRRRIREAKDTASFRQSIKSIQELNVFCILWDVHLATNRLSCRRSCWIFSRIAIYLFHSPIAWYTFAYIIRIIVRVINVSPCRRQSMKSIHDMKTRCRLRCISFASRRPIFILSCSSFVESTTNNFQHLSAWCLLPSTRALATRVIIPRERFRASMKATHDMKLDTIPWCRILVSVIRIIFSSCFCFWRAISSSWILFRSATSSSYLRFCSARRNDAMA